MDNSNVAQTADDRSYLHDNPAGVDVCPKALKDARLSLWPQTEGSVHVVDHEGYHTCTDSAEPAAQCSEIMLCHAKWLCQYDCALGLLGMHYDKAKFS